jgi:hypothetical protein
MLLAMDAWNMLSYSLPISQMLPVLSTMWIQTWGIKLSNTLPKSRFLRETGVWGK